MRAFSKIFFLTGFLALVSFSTSCDHCRGDYGFNTDVFFLITLFDQTTKENLLQILGRYNPDSVQIENAQGNISYPGPVESDGVIVWTPFRQVTPALDSALLKTYYVKLQLNGIDYDTLLLDYKVTTDDCNEQILAYIKLYYNGELVFDKENWARDITVHLNK